MVLAAFMLGLTLGSHSLGRLADRTDRPWLLFALLEAAIGLYGALGTVVLPALAPWYARMASPFELSTGSGSGTRFVIAAVALLLPTFLMGGTIPALVRGLVSAESKESGSRTDFVIGGVYALNTLGAALGAFAAGFVLLPALGTVGATWAAVAANLAIAVAVAATLGRRQAGSEAEASERRDAPVTADATLEREPALLAFAVFGAVALAIQLAWVQALTQVLGSSVYAFSLTLAGYLTGLALGGFALTAWTRPAAGRNLPARAAAWIATAAGVSVALGLRVFELLPGIFLQAFRWNLETRFGWLTAFALFVVWCLLLVPTTLFGFLAPLLAGACSGRNRSVGRDVGRAYAFNTAGTTLGALAAGFWLLPTFGLQRTLLLGSVGLAACGGLLLWARRPRPRWAVPRAFALVGGVSLLALATPRWDPAITTMGPFINASRILDLPQGSDFREAIRERNQILFYRESAIGSVSVREVANDRLLVINGKTDGSRFGDRRTQLALGHLPALLHPQPEKVLVVGFGTGMTPAAVAAHLEVGRLDVAEISREVIEASKFFAEENRGVLFDPRFRLHTADARNFLLASQEEWDLIISEPSNPWISGVANLFTKEYFELARSRLAAGGLMGQWFQSYGMSGIDLRSIIRTYSEVFEHVSIWSPQPGDLILVGSEAPHALDARRADRLGRLPSGAQDFEAAGWAGADDFARMLLLEGESIRSYGEEAPLNTDTHPRVEFNAPRNLYRETTFDNMLDLVEHASRTVVPMLYGGDERQGAFGLASPGAALRPELRVQWIELEAAEPGPLPTLAVSLRRLAVLELAEKDTGSGGTELEVEVLSEARAPGAERIAERLSRLLEGTTQSRSASTLADGTETTRISTEAQSGVAWSCPAKNGVHRIFVAVARDQDLGRLEQNLACSS